MKEKLENIVEILHLLAVEIEQLSSDPRTMTAMFGWNLPAVTSRQLAILPQKLSDRVKEISKSGSGKYSDYELDQVIESIKTMRSVTTQYMFNGSGNQAVPAFVSTMACISEVFDQTTNWQVLVDTKAMPNQLARRLLSIQAELNALAPDKEELQSQITLIREATETAESLPADLESLKNARKQVDGFMTDSSALNKKLIDFNNEAKDVKLAIQQKKQEADALVAQCDEAYRITTTAGLAGAFTDRATKSTTAMWIWVGGLLAALLVGAWIGSLRITALSTILDKPNPHWGVITVQIVLSLLSVGAPLWFAWLSTKQINQRFRLSEDYAFKAAVAKAYEGYRKEAVRIDPLYEARLFGSALSRLEEAPLRLVETDVHGSPWHELFASTAFQEAIKTIPNFKNEVIQLMKEKIPSFSSLPTVPKSAATTAAEEVK